MIERAAELLVAPSQLRWVRRSILGRGLAPLYWLYARRLWLRVRPGPIPHHLALILDGNRRFAAQSGLGSVRAGYRAGADRIDDVLAWCERAGVGTVTLWAMSVDNLERPASELTALCAVIEGKLTQLLPRAKARGWRLRAIGRRELLPVSLADTLSFIEGETAGHRRLTVQFAVGYGGREEIIDALRRWAETEPVGELTVRDALARLSLQDVTRYLYGGDVPEPDLILRTSGEVRLSGFLLWQSVHSEFYFTDVLWPEFREIDFLRALRDYQGRTRRYGR